MMFLEGATPLQIASQADVTGVLGILKTIASGVLDMVKEVVNVILTNPLLLIPFGVIMLYTVIATAKRFLH